MANVLNAADIETLEKEIRTDAAAAPQDIKDLFCKLWPDAKKAIDALLKTITNPIVKLILQGVEAVGEATQKAICPNTIFLRCSTTQNFSAAPVLGG